MPHALRPSIALLVAALLSPVPLGIAAAADAGSSDEMATGPAATEPQSPADQAMMQGMMRMRHAMETAPIIGDADHDFVAMMVPHHQGAVSMAEIELRYGRDPELKRLARAIIVAQDREIAQMDAWAAAHPSPQPHG